MSAGRVVRTPVVLAVVAIALSASLPALAAGSRNLTAERQQSLDAVLSHDRSEDIAADRGTCLAGRMPASVARGRTAGALTLPDAADYCITVLIRSAREGATEPLHERGATGPTPASAIDNGFMAGYSKGDAIPADLPTMEALAPIAERCLGQSERDTDLCYSTGYGFGLRARQGETVIVR